MLSSNVEKAVLKALEEAKNRRHEFATVEHLCFVLFDDARIKSLFVHMGVSVLDLKSKFLNYLDNQVESLPKAFKLEPIPSLGLQRVLQRASVHVVGAGKDEVLTEHVLVATFDEEESFAVYMMQQAGINRLDLVSIISHGGFSDEENEQQERITDEPFSEPEVKKSALTLYATNLTDLARQQKLDKVIGREKELERIIQVLCRKTKNNPLFVGEPGVGKTALAYGLANKIVSNDVPQHLSNAEIFLLDMGLMLAGSRYRGDFENRMKQVIKELKEKENAILMIDEIHTIVGAGSTNGSSMDASNLLKPVLSSGEVKCIGSTTYKEYKNYFEKDHGLARRFQKIDVHEPNAEDSVKIIQGIKHLYEQFHQVEIENDALKACVDLSIRFLHEKKLPDKAIDLLDESCSWIKLNAKDAKVKKVCVSTVEKTVAKMANVPSNSVSTNEKNLLIHLRQNLSNQIFGQQDAIDSVVDSILISRSGLRNSEKPIACFLFVGPTGVGKTQVARSLSESLGVKLIRFDMSEYMERHSASRLIGAPPGYVGYDQGGLLTDAVAKNPYCVLLLDEIEKAHQDVFNMLLQVMDYGKLTDNFGKQTDFRHVILIMTSNVGASLLEHKAIGFNNSEGLAYKHDKAIKSMFSPEFRNRLDKIVMFKKLPEDIIAQVVDKFLSEFSDTLKAKNISITFTQSVKNYLLKEGFSEEMGARPIERLIEDKIKKPLALMIINADKPDKLKVKVDFIDGKVKIL